MNGPRESYTGSLGNSRNSVNERNFAQETGALSLVAGPRCEIKLSTEKTRAAKKNKTPDMVDINPRSAGSPSVLMTTRSDAPDTGYAAPKVTVLSWQ